MWWTVKLLHSPYPPKVSFRASGGEWGIVWLSWQCSKLKVISALLSLFLLFSSGSLDSCDTLSGSHAALIMFSMPVRFLSEHYKQIRSWKVERGAFSNGFLVDWLKQLKRGGHGCFCYYQEEWSRGLFWPLLIFSTPQFMQEQGVCLPRNWMILLFVEVQFSSICSCIGGVV